MGWAGRSLIDESHGPYGDDSADDERSRSYSTCRSINTTTGLNKTVRRALIANRSDGAGAPNRQDTRAAEVTVSVAVFVRTSLDRSQQSGAPTQTR